MKKIIIFILLSIIMLEPEAAFSESINNSCEKLISIHKFKVKKTDFKLAEIYYSNSGDGKRKDLFFPRFSVTLGKGVRTDLITDAKNTIIEKKSLDFCLSIASYWPNPDLAVLNDFSREIELFDGINKINYLPGKKAIIGHGYLSLGRLTVKELMNKGLLHKIINKKRKYFIIVALGDSIKLFWFDSQKKFNVKAKKLLKTENIKLEKAKDFFKEKVMQAIEKGTVKPNYITYKL